jgi:glycosyltransferase involved in cell wall biosynthesis
LSRIRIDFSSAVLFGGHPWAGTPYGLHHVARALSDLGAKVLYVEPPFSPLHLAAGLGRGRVVSTKPRPSGEDGISLLSPFTLAPHQNQPLLRSRFLLDYWTRLSVPRLSSAIRGTPFEHPSLTICGSALYCAQALSLDANIRGYRMADDERLFASSSQAMLSQIKTCLPMFDVIFATTALLADSARSQGARRVVALPNGVDPKRFLAKCSQRPPEDLASISTPRVIYAGATEAWFGWDVLTNAAKILPLVNFVILSTSKVSKPDLPANIHLLGRKPHGEVANYMAHCDAGILPFQMKDNAAAIAAIDPIKLWEYLACGLPAIASNDLDLPKMAGALWRYGTVEEFVQSLNAALARGRRADGLSDIQNRQWSSILAQALDDLAEEAP